MQAPVFSEVSLLRTDPIRHVGFSSGRNELHRTTCGYTSAMRRCSRRWLLWLAVASLLVGLLGAAVLSILFGLSHRDRVTMSHIGRLKLGMDESKVRRILGEERTRIPCADEPRWQQVEPSWSAEEWKGKCIVFRALFDSDQRLRDWSARLTPGKFEWTDRVANWIDWMGF
jgi:hypothetical protein